MTRTAKYKDIAYNLDMNVYSEEYNYWLYHTAASGAQAYSHNMRRAAFEAALLDNLLIDINDLELLVGRCSPDFVVTEEMREIYDKGRLIVESVPMSGGWDSNATGHRVVDYEKLLSVGIRGVLAEVDGYLAAINMSAPDAYGKLEFYNSTKLVLQAVCRFAERYRLALIEKSRQTDDPQRKNELLAMAANFEKAPYEPCTHFYEALQCMWFLQYCLACCHDISLTGRLDNYLYPFYKSDRESGYLTDAFAFELIEQLYFKHNEIYGSWPAAIMVGGVDRAGNPVWNELSTMCIRAIGTTGLVNPSVNISYTEDMPEELFDLSIEMIADGHTRPAFFNDKVIQEGLIEAGMLPEDARYYIHSTCVEISPVGCSNVMVATPYINLNKAFEYILGEKKPLYGASCDVEHDIDFTLECLDTFDKFQALAYDVTREIIRFRLTDVCGMAFARHHYGASPLASAFINDCLARGLDSGAGGARYSYVYPCFPGYVNFVDILAAVKKAVYEEKKLTLRQLSELCRSNFSDERLRLYLLNACPKFGNDDDSVDEFGVEVYELIRSELKKYMTCTGATFHPSYFAWIMHGRLGAVASATPDGRRQAEALSENLGAMQGRDKNGPLAVIRSISKIDQKSGIGGIATNFRFSKAFMRSPEGKNAIKSFIRVFMDNRCFEIQFNVVDQQDLMEARKNPEKYSSLLVRVAGYSDYFINLDPVIQEEIIKRSEHDSI